MPPDDSNIETPDTNPVNPGTGPVDPGIPPDPAVTEVLCRSIGLDASPPPRVVDIIMAIDNSSAMADEIASVQDNINAHFAELLDQSRVDYRVILVSEHGRAVDRRVCIKAPLGGSLTCDPPPSVPMNGLKFFHYDQQISDRDSLFQLYVTYDKTDRHGLAQGGWRSWLRPGSMRVFIEVSGGDDLVLATIDSFETGLAQKGFFPSSTQREYTFHSIVGVPANSPVSAPWLSTAPLMSERCATAALPGTRFQTLSVRTGGLRFPVCEFLQYGAAFEAMALEIVRAAGVRCEITPPPPPANFHYGPIAVEYTPTGGTAEHLAPVPEPSGCSATGFLRDAATDRVTLCPQACLRLTADASASIAAHYTCVMSP